MRRASVAGDRSGFTLIELIVAVAILVLLGAALIPNLIGSLDQARVDEAVESLQDFEDGMTEARSDNQDWPGRLSHLSTPITTADLNICGSTYSAGKVNNWAGPYLDRVIPRTGVPIGIGIAQDSLVREVVSGNDGYLKIRITSVTTEDAEALNKEVDADNSSTGGTVRWTSDPGGEGLVTVEYLRPIRGC